LRKGDSKSLFQNQPDFKTTTINKQGPTIQNLGAFPAFHAGNRAIRSNSSQTALRFAPGFPLLSLARPGPRAAKEESLPENFRQFYDPLR
jgi:hypothetical protein